MTRRPRIIYHHRTRAQGAEGTHIRGIIKAFRRRGWEVDIIAPPGIRTHDESHSNKNNGADKFWAMVSNRTPQIAFEALELSSNLYSLYKLQKALKNKEAAFIYERYSLFGWAGTYVARKHRTPIILEINDATVIPRSRPLVNRRMASQIEKWVFENATHLSTITNKFKHLICQMHSIDGSRIHVLPNAVDLDKFPYTSNYETFRSSARFTLGMVGAFVAWHGTDFLVRSIANFLKETHSRLLLVGDGPIRSDIEKAIQEMMLHQYVEITGFVPHSAVPSYIDQMDVCVMANSNQNQHASPIKMFEYMACGKPVLAPAYESIQEIITHGLDGWLFKPMDPESFLQGINQLYSDAALRKRLGLPARETVVTQHTWDHRVQEIESSLES